MKKMLSLIAILSLAAMPVLAEKCCGNKPKPGSRQGETMDKCGCNANKPTKGQEKCGCNANKPTKACGSCGSCNTCKPCGGCCGK